MDQPVIPFDLNRMFLGSEPALFYLEIVFRTCVVYVYALVLIRWVGGRGIAQMSTVEFLLVIALGSAVGDALFYPEVPLLHAMLAITIVVLINKALDVLIFRYRPVEAALNGKTAEVIRDGVINLDELRHHKIGRSELFAGAREAGIANLGEVRSAYLEASGRFSFFRYPEGGRGLSIEPAWAVRPPETLRPAAMLADGARAVCLNCGILSPKSARTTPAECHNCSHQEWTIAQTMDED